jgi:hypothetical protein
VKRHRFDPVSFVWGALFVGLGVAVLNNAISPRLLWFRSFWPFLIVVFGLAILSSIRRSPKPENEESVVAPGDQPS